MNTRQTNENPNPPLADATGSEWDEYVRLLLSMATDTLMGCGPSTRGTFVANLRIIADNMEKLIPNVEHEPPEPAVHGTWSRSDLNRWLRSAPCFCSASQC